MRKFIAYGIVLTIAFSGLIFVAAGTANAEYNGARWERPQHAICVTTKFLKTSAAKTAVKESVNVWNEKTKLRVIRRSDCYASGYSQRIVIKEGYYSDKFAGRTTYPKGFKWFYPKTKGPWLKSADGGTWAFKSPVTIYINRNYTNKYTKNKRQHVISHEIGHALGLGHHKNCKSVMVEHWNCSPLYLRGGSLDWNGTTSNPGINLIYKNG